jgi:transcriptional regulator with XRE-family HTH domain
MGRTVHTKPRELPPGKWPWHEKFEAYLRHIYRKTLTDFAKEKGYSQSTLSSWVRGKTDPKTGEFRRAAISFDMMRCLALDTGLGIEFWSDDSIPFEKYEAYTSISLRRSFDRQVRRLLLSEEEQKELAEAFRSDFEVKRTLALRRAASGRHAH